MADRTCSIDGCGRAVHARLLCQPHYRQEMRRTNRKRCQECGKPHFAHGKCSACYQRARHAGWVPPVAPSPEDRFWSKVDVGHPLGCWLWLAARNENGYGRFSVDGQDVFAHRHAFTLLRGAIPDGLHLDHLCRNTPCVNPDHLEPVTHRENMRRGHAAPQMNAKKTRCPRGHPFSGDNLILVNGGRSRWCRECRRIESAERWRRKRDGR